LDAEQAEQGADIDSAPEQIKDPWFPISVVDTPPSGIEQNPYIAACETGKSDEVIRLLLLRGFLLLGTSAYESKVKYDFTSVYGKLEAANLYEAAKKTENGLNIIKELQNLYGKTEPKEQAKALITNNGLKGRDTIKNPGVAEGKEKSIMKKSGMNYQYSYIGDVTKMYIPVNTNFDGSEFYYSNNKLKSNKDLKKISDNVIFVSNNINQNLNETPKDGYYLDDGAYMFNIIDKNNYTSRTMTPSFGTSIIESDYKDNINGVIKPDTFIKAYTDDKLDQNIPKYILGGLNPLVGNYKALEINFLNYSGYKNGEDATDIGEGYTTIQNGIAPTLTAFYTQHVTNDGEFKKFGAYLCAPMSSKYYDSKMPKDTGKKFTIHNYERYCNVDRIIRYTVDYTKGRASNQFGQQKKLIEGYLGNTVKPYVPYIEFGFNESTTGNDLYTFSLFGSKFYNYQNIPEAKALLFLHCFPFTGVIIPGGIKPEYGMLDTATETPGNIFPDTSTVILSIKSMFKTNAAFVAAPKAWVLFMGGILWRRAYYKEKNGDDPIIWNNSGSNYPRLIPGYGPQNDDRQPDSREFLYFMESGWEEWGMFFANGSNGFSEHKSGALDIYNQIDETILGLCIFLNKKLKKAIREKQIKGVLLITHSKLLVKFLEHDKFVCLDNTEMTSEEWCNREIFPLNIEDLHERSRLVHKEIQNRINNK
jgi:hypothetical protein